MAIEAIVAEMLSAVAGGRCYPQFRPQSGTLPACVWDVVSLFPQSRISQSLGPSLWQARVQVNCVAGSFAELLALADDVQGAMHLKSGTYATKHVSSSLLDQKYQSEADQESSQYLQPIDFIITFYD